MVQAPGAAFTSVLLPLVPVSTFLRERRPNRVARYLRAGLQYLDTRKRAPERTRVTTSISCQGYSQAQDASAALSPAELEHVARHGLSRFGCEGQ